MRGKVMKAGLVLVIVGALCTIGISQEAENRPMKHNGKWAVHDDNEPKPEVKRPGAKPGDPPSDAIVIFDGTDTTKLSAENGDPTRWIINDEGALECTRKAGTVRTKQEFGSIQLHIEWATPKKIEGSGQGRGNSGIFFQGIYELQVLCSHENPTYADGQAGAIYGQKKPLVNVSRPAGEWQTYDVIYHRPIFKGKTNEVIRPGTITVFHNGVLIQDNWEIKGTTHHKRTADYRYHADKLPLKLQDHNNAIRYRNIWVREIDDIPATE
jgi:hypothetical protein